MKVILLQDVPRLGRAHDVKEVSGGYAANYLIPHGLVEVATAGKIQNAESKKKQTLEEKEVQDELLAKNLAALKSVSILVSSKANEQGHLFQGIHRKEITNALKGQAHIDLLPEHIALEHPLKEVGEYSIDVRIGKKKGSFKLVVRNQNT